MALYHAYRPQTFAEIVGQDHVKQTLAAAVARGQVAHAYLFSGPRGIGKTSVARILAMAVNCATRNQLLASSFQLSGKKKSAPKSSKLKAESSSEPCGVCPSCLAIRSGSDLAVIEIDAASNRGIDEIRQLKENIGFAPAALLGPTQSGSARKVYIIDEVHMLTKEAFNALLKTLEEPPAHAILILATTELHRVPDTIISRTQHFSFKRATLADTRTHLGVIAAKEGLTLSPEATELIALHAAGAFRDALSLLDQLAALGEKKITAEHVRLLLGVAPEVELLALLAAALSDDMPSVHTALARFGEAGYDPAALADALITTLRHVLWAHYGLPSEGSERLADFATQQGSEQSPATVITLIERLIIAKQQLRWSPLPLLPLELALLGEQVPNTNSQVPNNVQVPSSKVAPARDRDTSEVVTSVTPPDGGVKEERANVPVTESQTKPVVSPSAPDLSQGVEESLRGAQPDPSRSLPRPGGAQDDKHKGIVTSKVESPALPAGSRQSTVDSGDIAKIWTNVLATIRPKNAQLAALLGSSRLLGIEAGQCRIEVPFSFYADRLKDHKSADVVTTAIAAETGLETVIHCVVAGTTQASDNRHQISGQLTTYNSQLTTRTQDDLARDVMEVFGVAQATGAVALSTSLEVNKEVSHG